MDSFKFLDSMRWRYEFDSSDESDSSYDKKKFKPSNKCESCSCSNFDSSDENDSDYDKIKFKSSDKSKSCCSDFDSHLTLVRNLINAIETRDDVSVIQNYLSKCNITSIDHNRYNTCLHIAVCVVPYDLNVIEVLLKSGAKVNAQNFEGYTPLHAATENPQCDVDLVKMLLNGGGNPNTQNCERNTPLHMFLIKYSIQPSRSDTISEIVKLLLECGARTDIRNEYNFNALEIALSAPHCDGRMISMLIKHGADLPVKLLLQVMESNLTYKLDIVKILLKHQPRFIKHNADNRFTVLHSAISFRVNSGIVKELIKKGADVNAKDFKQNTPLHLANNCSYSVIETLVKYGADIDAKNQYGNTPLLEFVKGEIFPNHKTAIAALIELGADLESLDLKGNSALHYALSNSSAQTDILKLLLENFVKPTNVNFPYDPPIYYCSDNNNKALLYIQFFLLHESYLKYKAYKPERMISFDLYGPALSNMFSKFRNTCLSQIFQMRKDRLRDYLSLYEYVRDHIMYKICHELPELFVKEILIRINSNKYPNCMDLLRACVKRDKLIEYLPNVIVYVNVPSISNTKQNIILNYESTLNLASFLDKNTLLSLIEAFSDYFCSDNKRKCRKSCTRKSSKFSSSKSKCQGGK